MNSTYYYSVLGLDEKASLSEVKNAFRNKAKKYHPDVSHNPESIHMFIEITEAYQFLLDKFNDQKKNKEINIHDFEEAWLKQKRDKAKEYAQQQARMNYEQFQKSYIYRSATMFFVFYDYLMFFVGIFMVIISVAGIILKINIDEFTPETAIISAFGCILGSLFVIFTHHIFLRK